MKLTFHPRFTSSTITNATKEEIHREIRRCFYTTVKMPYLVSHASLPYSSITIKQNIRLVQKLLYNYNVNLFNEVARRGRMFKYCELQEAFGITSVLDSQSLKSTLLMAEYECHRILVEEAPGYNSYMLRAYLYDIIDEFDTLA